jgi:uncharacterized protein with NAD-binding domain and iron-sulfur cluster
VSRQGRLKVAIIGGGCASVTAAFELTRPQLAGRYEVTLYQMGWRLGGKGASGRGSSGRIEEHGLHLWMGYYENAFRLMRECYAELGRERGKHPIADWSDAFIPANANAVADWSPSGRWLPWKVTFPPAPGLPGDGTSVRWSVADYLARAASLLRTLLETLRVQRPVVEPPEDPYPELRATSLTPEVLTAALNRLLKYGALGGLGATIEAVRLLESALGGITAYPQSLLAGALEMVTAALQKQLDALVRADDEVRRLWEVIDLLLAVIRGSIRFRLAFDPRGFDAIDDYDSRQWLRLNGASESSINSAFIRALYDLAFAYERGDPERPRIAAGAALRGAMRAFFSYRGAFFWKMRAGMGDVVFAPLYEVLKRRGVRFEFFHKLREVTLAPAASGEPAHVASLELDVQAHVRGADYQPLVDVRGLPCWPSAPDYSQLADAERILREGWDFESQWDTRCASSRTLKVRDDFDFVVLGVGLGVIPYVCRSILERDERWRDMVERVQSVPTQAFQLWMSESMPALGWTDGPVNLSGFVEPFDTWADMTHVLDREAWPSAPSAVAYFCNVLADREQPEHADPSSHRSDAARQRASALVSQEYERVKANAQRFMDRDLPELWPAARDATGQFRWNVLVSECAEAVRSGPASFESQFWTANVRPSDRYSQALPGSTRFRISPLDPTYDNMTVAGDWTDCSLNMGCVEAAVMSGKLAAHALSRSPALSEIIGYDHP